MTGRRRNPIAGLVLSVVTALAAGMPGNARAEDLAPGDLSNLIASGAEGTTIIFEGGARRVYFSTRYKNVARKGLGPKFMQQLQAGTIAEGVFVASIVRSGKVTLISGLAGIAADQDSGNGILVLVQTFPTDTTVRAFETRAKDRLFALVTVDETASFLRCTRTEWIRMGDAQNRNAQKKSTGPCEFVVGNVVAANLAK